MNNKDLNKVKECLDYINTRIKELNKMHASIPDTSKDNMNKHVYDEYTSKISSIFSYINKTYVKVLPMIDSCIAITRQYNDNYIVNLQAVRDDIVLHTKYVNMVIDGMNDCPTDPSNEHDMHTITFNIFLYSCQILDMNVSLFKYIQSSFISCYSLIKTIQEHESTPSKIVSLLDIIDKKG